MSVSGNLDRELAEAPRGREAGADDPTAWRRSPPVLGLERERLAALLRADFDIKGRILSAVLINVFNAGVLRDAASSSGSGYGGGGLLRAPRLRIGEHSIHSMTSRTAAARQRR
jgi:hypothetical protein